MSRILKLVAGGMLVVSGMAALGGCSSEPDVEMPPQTEGERLRLEAARKERKAEMMLRAERKIAEGKGKQAEGQTLKDQGKAVEGEKKQAEGEVLIREGEALQKQAEQIDTSVEMNSSASASPTTRPARD